MEEILVQKIPKPQTKEIDMLTFAFPIILTVVIAWSVIRMAIQSSVSTTALYLHAAIPDQDGDTSVFQSRFGKLMASRHEEDGQPSLVVTKFVAGGFWTLFFPSFVDTEKLNPLEYPTVSTDGERLRIVTEARAAGAKAAAEVAQNATN